MAKLNVAFQAYVLMWSLTPKRSTSKTSVLVSVKMKPTVDIGHTTVMAANAPYSRIALTLTLTPVLHVLMENGFVQKVDIVDNV